MRIISGFSPLIHNVLLFHTWPWPPFDSEKRVLHVFFHISLFFSYLIIKILYFWKRPLFSRFYYNINNILKIKKKFTFVLQILLLTRKCYFRHANQICGKYMLLLPRFSGAKGGYFGRVWNKIYFSNPGTYLMLFILTLWETSYLILCYYSASCGWRIIQFFNHNLIMLNWLEAGRDFLFFTAFPRTRFFLINNLQRLPECVFFHSVLMNNFFLTAFSEKVFLHSFFTFS